MPKVEILRPSCIKGYWGIPNGLNGLEWVTAADMMRLYISQQEGREVNLHEFRRLSFEFSPDNPREAFRDGSLGKVTIIYEFKR